ncbi:MAG: DUF1579 family protein [Planctomycetes bacterium]|nr:DUF1579 family protein [Planctomycetota bacterium]MCB9920127.1 DUF1579 family protein [Planctomycetota bacterium]
MNRHVVRSLFLAPLVAILVPSLTAQDEAAPPNPKMPQHERMASLAGTWRTETKMAGMPGVPGMEEATEMVGVEQADLVCDGLWLKVSGNGTCAGQQCSGMWLLGYDPYAKNYTCIAVNNMEETPCCLDARYDEKTKTWHFQGKTSMGEFRSEFTMDGPDKTVEIAYSKDEDGKETEFMRTVRTRIPAGEGSKTAKPVAASKDASAEKLPAPLAALHADCGTWDADFKMEMPGMEAMTAKCREVVEPVCGGKWTWSNFTGEMMGAPFEGHALTGYDSKANKVVSFWIDSMSGAVMRTDGTYDAEKKLFTMSGTSYDETGKRSPVSSTAKSNGKDERGLRMIFGEGDSRSMMAIVYRRAKS